MIGSVIVAILILLFMITIHEFGHYIVSKIFDFKVNEFSIGMGPALYKKKRKNGEYFSIRLLPLGGYCAFEGEDDDADDPRAFNNKKPWQRILVLLAGATMNFLAAIMIFCISFAGYGQLCYETFEIAKPTPTIEEIAPAVLKDEDIILSLNGKTIYSPTDMISALKGKKKGDTVPAKVLREKEEIETEITLVADPVSKNMSDINGVLDSLSVAKLSVVTESANTTNKDKVLKGDVLLRISDEKPVDTNIEIEEDTDTDYIYYIYDGNERVDKCTIYAHDYDNFQRTYTTRELLDFVNNHKESEEFYLFISRSISETESERILLTYNAKEFFTNNTDGVIPDDEILAFFNISETTSQYRLYTQNVKFGFFRNIGRGIVYAFKNVGATLAALGQLLTGKLGLDALGGPVTTISMTSQMVSLGFNYLLEISGFIGVSLAVFNLLPIPALDGARAVFVIIEWIRKKPVKREVEGMIHTVGLIALLVFAVMIDLIKCI